MGGMMGNHLSMPMGGMSFNSMPMGAMGGMGGMGSMGMPPPGAMGISISPLPQ